MSKPKVERKTIKLAKAPRLSVPNFIKGDKVAAAEFKKLSKALLDAGIITVLDGPMLGALCSSLSTYVQATIAVQGEDKILTRKRSGDGYVNPNLRIAGEALNQLYKLCTEFGLTPAARARMKLTAQMAKPAVGKGYAEAVLRHMNIAEIGTEDTWQPPVAVTG